MTINTVIQLDFSAADIGDEATAPIRTTTGEEATEEEEVVAALYTEAETEAAAGQEEATLIAPTTETAGATLEAEIGSVSYYDSYETRWFCIRRCALIHLVF